MFGCYVTPLQDGTYGFYERQRENLKAYLNIPLKVSFFEKGIQQSSLIITMVQKKKGLERMEVLITSHVKVFLGNKYSSYIYILLEIQSQVPLEMFMRKL